MADKSPGTVSCPTEPPVHIDTGQMREKGSMNLHQAAADGNIAQLRLLIDAGAEIDLRDETARTPLMSAVSAQSYAAAKTLLERGADVNARDFGGSGVLANCRDKKIFELLMSYGVHLNATNNDGGTILHDIAWTEADIAAATAAALIARGCDVNARDSRGQRPLHTAAAAGNIGLMNVLLSLGADIELRDDVGQTPIFDAGTVDSVEFLVQHGAKADARDDNGLPALYCAFPVQVTKALIAHGADIHARGASGCTALHMRELLRVDRRDIIECLVACGAALNARDNAGNTPLHEARNAEVAALFLLLGADPDIANEFGQTALHIAALHHDGSLVAPLLAGHASLHVRDWHGNTALHLVRTQAAAATLLAHGANAGTANEAGSTPLHLAWSEGVVSELLAHGASVHDRDNEGRTPLHTLPRFQGDEDIIRLLLAHGADPNARSTSDWTPLHEKVAFGVKSMTILIEAGADVNAVDDEGFTPLTVALRWTHDGGERARLLRGRGGNSGGGHD